MIHSSSPTNTVFKAFLPIHLHSLSCALPSSLCPPSPPSNPLSGVLSLFHHPPFFPVAIISLLFLKKGPLCFILFPESTVTKLPAFFCGFLNSAFVSLCPNTRTHPRHSVFSAALHCHSFCCLLLPLYVCVSPPFLLLGCSCRVSEAVREAAVSSSPWAQPRLLLIKKIW